MRLAPVTCNQLAADAHIGGHQLGEFEGEAVAASPASFLSFSQAAVGHLVRAPRP